MSDAQGTDTSATGSAAPARQFVYKLNPAMRAPSQNPRRNGRIVCPHCWHDFPVEDTLFIAQHDSLGSDPVAENVQAGRRFLPSRFTAAGNAIDAAGKECPDRACPRCHLRVPRALYEHPPLMLSIVGETKSGKSYLLAAMIWKLRELLPREFHYAVEDADARTNSWLNDYERTLFLANDPSSQVYLEKTQGEEEDVRHCVVMLDGMRTMFPLPSVFTLRAEEGHRRAGDESADLCRNLILYDNAGEHFQPGRVTVKQPVTQHLTRASAILFVFDPTMDPRIAQKIDKTDHDSNEFAGTYGRQDVLLTEMSGRVREQRGLPFGETTDLPLFVVCTKFDVWRELLPVDLDEEPYIHSETLCASAVDVDQVLSASLAVRSLLQKHSPEIVAAAESFSREVVFIPVSALGHRPELMQGQGYRVKPKDIRPFWVTVPMMMIMNQLSLVPGLKARSAPTRSEALTLRQVGDQIHVSSKGTSLYSFPLNYTGHVMECPVTREPLFVPRRKRRIAL